MLPVKMLYKLLGITKTSHQTNRAGLRAPDALGLAKSERDARTRESSMLQVKTRRNGVR